MSASKRSAFTLVELLVVISIIGVLMGLALPAVQNARESARRGHCFNNQKNLAQAVVQYHNSYRRFPGYTNSVNPQNFSVSWAVMLFPYIDRQDQWATWSRKATAVSTTDYPESYIELLICPSNPPPIKTTSPWSYAVNGGFYSDITAPDAIVDGSFNSTEKAPNGVFFNHYGPSGSPSVTGFNPNAMPAMSLSYLSSTSSDGASTTLMLTENVQQQCNVLTQGWRTLYSGDAVNSRMYRAVIWHLDDTVTSRRINNSLTTTVMSVDVARPSSWHPQGVVVVFCDGHTRFINQAIDYGIYRQIMTSAGRLSADTINRRYNDADL